MTMERRRLGRVEPETPLWWKRYRQLLSEGFVHDEASVLAERRIGTKDMVAGRKRRKDWYATIKPLGLSDAEYEERVMEMYDTHEWMDQYSQFYAEEGDGESDYRQSEES